MALRAKKTVDDIWPVAGKRFLVRVDFNVPFKGGVITNDFRIRSGLPTLQRIIDNGGICIVMSHLGRPKGVKYEEVLQKEASKKAAKLSWKPVTGGGKTAFFARLSGSEKMKVLSWSTAEASAQGLSEEPNHGKTALFAALSQEEKARLLERYSAECNKKTFSKEVESNGYEADFSLKAVCKRMEELLGRDVHWAPDCLNADEEIRRLGPGDMLLLENVRFYSDEGGKTEKERQLMTEKLASYADYFVSDAFGTAHRDSVTMTGIPRLLGHGACGYLMEKEIKYFAKVLNNPPRPLVAIVGGAKVSDKIALLDNMLLQIDKLVIGGGMAYTFLKAQGKTIGKSLFEKDATIENKATGEMLSMVQYSAMLLEKARERNVEVYLPVDHVCHTEFKETDSPLVTQDANIPETHMGLDVGPKSVKLFQDVVAQCKSVIWNGPMGVFEKPCYANGTFSIAKTLADETQRNGLLSIIGGGDSTAAAEKSGNAPRMSHVSTGGGASLELLEGKILPGVAILDDKQTKRTTTHKNHYYFLSGLFERDLEKN